MSNDLTIQTDPAAQAKLDRLMERLQSQLGKGAEETVIATAYYVGRALGASTRRARKVLPLVANTGPTANRWPVYVERWLAGRKYRKFLRPDAAPEEVTKARRNPRSGLAAQSWLWIVGDLRGRVPSSPLRRPANAVSGTMKRGVNPEATLSNRLRYITSAVRYNGAHAIDSAMDRGARMGLHHLDKLAARAIR